MTQGRVTEDEASQRIRGLIRDELKLVAVSSDGWARLFRDPADGRLWELTYPSSEMQGGGPPALHVLTEELAHMRYSF